MVDAIKELLQIEVHHPASAFPDMLRWNMEGELITTAGVYGTGRGRTEAEWVASYYDRQPTMWASYQRVLCNKCHGKD